jgi:hypothetical protein
MATDQHRRIRPIATRYGGFLFRSRLEARWAVFFDTLGIKWLYEPQGFDVDGRPYLPDFCLLLGKMLWAEVKPAIDADPDGVSRFRSFIAARGDRGVVLTDIGPDAEDDEYLLIGPQPGGDYWEGRGFWAACGDDHHFGVVPGYGTGCPDCGPRSIWHSQRRLFGPAFDAARSARFDQRVSGG